MFKAGFVGVLAPAGLYAQHQINSATADESNNSTATPITVMIADGEVTIVLDVPKDATDAAKKAATTVYQDFQFDPAGLLDGFLTLNDRDILTGAGKISHALAVEQAKEQYRAYSADAPTGSRTSTGSCVGSTPRGSTGEGAAHAGRRCRRVKSRSRRDRARSLGTVSGVHRRGGRGGGVWGSDASKCRGFPIQ